ncbi:MAG: lytic transglycosylase domain-containing protein [Proteobacteria bacterium]|nr:lytic transglycosylase domain-containing protein [Pseudomonadota bacterium]
MPVSGALRAVVAVVALGSALAPAVEAGLAPAEVVRYEAAFQAVESGRWGKALDLAEGAGDPLPAKFIRWLYLAEAGSGASFAEITAFLAANPDWPGQDELRRRAEEAIDARVGLREALAWFAANPPVTTAGRVAYGETLMRAGDGDRARQALREAWVQGSFSTREEQAFHRRFRRLLTADDHRERLDRLIWNEQFAAAERMLRRVDRGHAALAQARIALARMSPGVDGAIARVPVELREDPGLVYERMRWRRRKGRLDDTAEMLAKAPKEPAHAAVWWTERAYVVRRLLAEGSHRAAYEIARDHAQSHGATHAEAEWLAGWIALRFLKDPEAALAHFTRLYNTVYFPVSRARGAYWTARAAEAKDEGWLAAAWYRTAAQYRDSYYGQLARQRLGERIDDPPFVDPAPDLASRARFRQGELARLVDALDQIGVRERIGPLLLHIDQQSESVEERYLAGRLALIHGRPDIAVRIARRASRDHILLATAGYPVVAIPEPAAAEPALIQAVIRQESGFNVVAVSSAGARGAMQLLPSTARRVAADLNLHFSRSRLTEDPTYNLQLGTAYLDSLLQEFAGSYVLALAAYNAGPHRARRWLKEFGDPRTSQVDLVDWVEMIPFTETRNYVQRVIESFNVYRNRPDPVEVALAPNGGLAR